jgi:hypothetical protein
VLCLSRSLRVEQSRSVFVCSFVILHFDHIQDHQVDQGQPYDDRHLLQWQRRKGEQVSCQGM